MLQEACQEDHDRAREIQAQEAEEFEPHVML